LFLGREQGLPDDSHGNRAEFLLPGTWVQGEGVGLGKVFPPEEQRVDVLALCPGATNTPAFAKSGARIDNVTGMPFMEPSEVVTAALKALGKKPGVVPGRVNGISSFIMTRFLSRRRAVALTGKNTRLLYPGR
jgi:hypothetical protein